MLPIVDSSSLSPLLRGLLNAATFLFALVLLERSADVFVDSTAAVARRFSIPTILIAMLTAGAEWEEVRRLQCAALSWSVLADLGCPTAQLAVVVSSLVSHNPSLAVSNIYGSFTGNILSSFSIGLLFAPAALHAGERRSAVIYSSVLLALSGTVAILAIPAISDQLGGAPGSPGMLRGRLVGGGLVAAFVVYVAAICWGIYRGAVVAPEDSDSDSDDDSPVPGNFRASLRGHTGSKTLTSVSQSLPPSRPNRARCSRLPAPTTGPSRPSNTFSYSFYQLSLSPSRGSCSPQPRRPSRRSSASRSRRSASPSSASPPPYPRRLWLTKPAPRSKQAF